MTSIQRQQGLRRIAAIVCRTTKTLAFKLWARRTDLGQRVHGLQLRLASQRRLRTLHRVFDAWRVMASAQLLVEKWHHHLLEHHRHDVESSQAAALRVFRWMRHRNLLRRVLLTWHRTCSHKSRRQREAVMRLQTVAESQRLANMSLVWRQWRERSLTVSGGDVRVQALRRIVRDNRVRVAVAVAVAVAVWHGPWQLPWCPR